MKTTTFNPGDKVKLQAKENSGGTLFGDQNGSGVMVFTTAGFIIILPIIGLVDVWANFRKLKRG